MTTGRINQVSTARTVAMFKRTKSPRCGPRISKTDVLLRYTSPWQSQKEAGVAFHTLTEMQ